MKLVYEDKHGAYHGVRPEFLKEFTALQINANFEAYDSRDSQRQFIGVKSSRVPDDQDIAAGKYGIDFHRAKPELQEALQYGKELPHALESTKWLANTAFVAAGQEEYAAKSLAWDDFYSYIWGSTPKTIWVAPHSGSVNRVPDKILPYPKLKIDGFTAGAAASCAFNDRSEAVKRLMISVHSHNWIGAVLDLGGFGIADEEKLSTVAEKTERKYHDRAQILASEYKQDFFVRATKWLKYIEDKRGTLNPKELSRASTMDRYTVDNIAKGLRLYGQEIGEFSPEEFGKAIRRLTKVEVPVMSTNYLFSGKQVGRLLRLSEKVGSGLLHSALQIECSKLYLSRKPELMTKIILDVKRWLFD